MHIPAGKKSKACGGGDNLLDSNVANNIAASSTAISDLSISYTTKHANLQEFILYKDINMLYEKR
jgi:hypothetical protein